MAEEIFIVNTTQYPVRVHRAIKCGDTLVFKTACGIDKISEENLIILNSDKKTDIINAIKKEKKRKGTKIIHCSKCYRNFNLKTRKI
ncbi:hypothetical protein [Persephonella sp.]